MTPENMLQLANMLLCAAAVGGLIWRLIGRWTLSYLLGKAVVILLTTAMFVLGIATARRASLGGPFNEAQYAVALLAMLVLAVVWLWPWLLEKDPPKPNHYRRGSPTSS